MNGRSIGSVFMAILLALGTGGRVGAADYHDTFVAGIRLFRGGRWNEASRLFEYARRQRPREAGRVQISGNDTEPYSPSYFLGEARYRLRDCEGARRAWDEAERSPSSLTRRMTARIEEGRVRCDQRRAADTPGPTDAPNDQNARSRAPRAPAPAPARGDAPRFSAGGDLPAPQRVKYVAPEYPDSARAAGLRGGVIVEATIGVNGRVTDTRVVRSIPGLDQAATDAVGQWEFVPTVVNGVAVPVVMTVTVFFTPR